MDSFDKSLDQVQYLSNKMGELKIKLQLLQESQQKVDGLVRQQIEHTFQLDAAEKGRQKMLEKISKVSDRVKKVEDFKLSHEAANKARSGLLAGLIKYGPIISGILLALIGVGISLKEMKP